MSERTLLRRFNEEVGMTPKAWLIQQQVFAAQRLLEASAAHLDDIALACGFASLEAFRLAFRKLPGWRRRSIASDSAPYRLSDASIAARPRVARGVPRADGRRWRSKR